MSENHDLDLALDECFHDVRAHIMETLPKAPADRPVVITARFRLRGPRGDALEGTVQLTRTPAPSDRPAGWDQLLKFGVDPQRAGSWMARSMAPAEKAPTPERPDAAAPQPRPGSGPAEPRPASSAGKARKRSPAALPRKARRGGAR